MADLSQAARFLELLDEEESFTFQTFRDSKAWGDAGGYPKVLHGKLGEHQEELVRLNELGAGIFVMVNAGDGVVHDGAKSCRTAANVVRVRAVFVDLDGAPLQPILDSKERPDWIVQSSPGRWHAYWRVNDCRKERFRIMQLALIRKFKGDPSVTDLPRVMRVPGFLHCKQAPPFTAQLYLPDQYDMLSEGCHDAA